MSSFTTPIRAELLDDGVRWRLLERFVYHVGVEGSGEIIAVPAGYVTDFASIPKVCWSIIGSPMGKYSKAAVVHDYLYDQGGLIPRATDSDGGTAYRRYSKADSDNIFKEAMRVLGVGNPRRWMMYQAVKLFGKGKF